MNCVTICRTKCHGMVTLNALPEPEEDIRSNHACFINILNILNITCYKKLLKHNLFFFSPIQI